MREQKFRHGDLVKVADNLGPYKQHFKSGCRAIVIASYAEQFGGSDTNSYTLFIEGGSRCSWYEADELTLIENDRADLLRDWEGELTAYRQEKSDIDWIFSNGNEVLDKQYGPSICALGEKLGITNMWGARGEGFVYLQNAIAVLGVAKPFLETNDKQGFLGFASRLV